MKRIMSLLKRSNNTGRVARNTFYLTLSEIFLKALGILWVVFLAHTFSVADYGKYNLVTSFIAIFSFLPDFGVGLIVIREIARDPKRSSYYLGNSFILNGILAVLTFCTVVAILFIGKFNVGVYLLILIAAITLVISTIRSVAIFYFDGREKMQYSAILNSLNTVLLLLFAFIFAMAGFGIAGVFWGMLLGAFISLMVSWRTLLKQVVPQFKYDFKIIRFYLLQGAPLGLASFASLVYTRIDVLVLSKFLGDHAVGVYSAATPFAFALVQLLNVPFVVAVYPALVRLHTEDKKRFERGIVKSLGVIALWSFPSCVFIALIAHLIVPFLFGSRYETAVPILQVLIFFVPFISLSALLYKVLIIMKKQIDYLYISIIGAVLSIVINIMLIPQFGLYGSAWASVITQFILFALYSADVLVRVRKLRS